MKCTLNHRVTTQVSAMKPGELGVTSDGYIFLRTIAGAACLNSIGRSYQDASLIDVLVSMLPAGTKVELEAE